MNLPRAFTTFCASAMLLGSAAAARADTGSPFYGDPPDEHHPWAIHDRNRPQPPLVTPGTFSTPDQPGKPPSDAKILFDGTDATLANWEADTKGSEPTKWVVKDGAMECVPKSGYVRTKAQFGDCQLHVEWAAPKNVQGDSQGRGNSGVFLMGLVECQVLDNYNNPTYADGFASSIYGQRPPLANALHAPGEWQVYDIVFRRPIYKDNQVVDPGHLTIFCNGVLTQDATVIEGPSGHARRTKAVAFPEKGPLKLQDHGNPVRYRNIWYRELAPTAAEGGTDGPLSAEATTAKRKQIAAEIREDARKLSAEAGNPVPGLLRLMESLVYETDDATLKQVQTLTSQVAEGGKASKDDVKKLQAGFAYLAKWKMIPADFPAKAQVDKLAVAQGVDTKKK
jgi:hypothetical protein